MSLRRALAIVLVAIVACGAVASPGSAQTTDPAAVPAMYARQSDQLVRMMGINLHLLDGRSAYGDFPRVLRQLRLLGIRHIRTDYSPSRKDLAAEIGQLWAAGIHTDLVMGDDPNTSVLPADVKALTTLPPNAVDGVEPMNEWNLFGPSNWASQDQAYERRLYSLVRAQPSLDTVKVLAPSLGKRMGFSDLGNLSSSLDYGNIHLYPGGAPPTNRVSEILTDEQLVSGSKQIVVTEAGYHNALNCKCTHPPITEQFASIYEPRLFLDYFLQPTVKRVYQYELYNTSIHPNNDFNGSFGLVLANGTTAKPSFGALRNLVSLAADPGPNFTTTPLAVTVSPGSNATTNPVQHVLVERRDGTYTLFVWRDISVWDQQTQQPAPVHPETATVTFGQPIASAAIYQPSAGSAPKSTVTRPTTLAVPLAGQVDAIRITP